MKNLQLFVRSMAVHPDGIVWDFSKDWEKGSQIRIWLPRHMEITQFPYRIKEIIGYL